MLDFSKILGAAKKLREQNLNLNEQFSDTQDAQNLEKMPQTVETPTIGGQTNNQDGINLEKTPTTDSMSTFPNKVKTTGTSMPVTSYITNINNGLSKLLKSNKSFSPVQQRKIAKLYTNARNKYRTSSQSEEETNAFNALKSNPIWRSLSNK